MLLTSPDCSSVANPSIGETTKERKTIKNKMRNDNVEHEYGPDPFNSILYEQKRLPIGLSMATGAFALQKTKYGVKWLQPGCEENRRPILSGMILVVTLESKEVEKSW